MHEQHHEMTDGTAVTISHGEHQTAHAHEGHGDQHAGHHEAQFARMFWISLVLTIPVVFFSDLMQDLFNYTAPSFTGSGLIEPLLASIIFWYPGWIFLRGAYDELRERQPGMMTLVALAISSGYAYSLVVSLGWLSGMPFYWELATLVTIMLLGHWMEMRAVGSAQSALSELAKLLPDTAERIHGDHSETVPVDALQVNDLVLVRPGARVPADGVVVEGRSDVDESMITGESRPVKKEPGDTVIGGTVNGSGSLRVRVSQTGEKTMLAGIMQLVAEAQSSRTRAQALADRAAFWLTIVAVATALIAFFGWSMARGLDDYTIERAVTTLVVACPHALGLAIPLVVAISTTLSARSGILVRDRTA
ncbi:MAG TPA: HAD-IC family P-type ATPase, partial [Nitrolancea sp.]|nr:HAD-IC family P-type ATPase [Nitrolancea sp.]